jgi:NAD(P)-dependent dehydrogenase (short-subunit alcohol dehydrogenase family)
VTGLLQEQTVLVIGRGGGIARAVTVAARDAGARVVAAGRDQRTLAAVYAGEPDITTETVDLTDEASIVDLGKRLGTVGHVVATAAARARGRVADLDRDAIRRSLDTTVIGPLLLAKHLAPRMPAGGSFVIFSGVAAAKLTVGTLGVAITNGATDVLARSLALELAPIRVNAISPGVIDTGAWDALGQPGQGRLLRRQERPQPGTAHRHRRRHRQRRPVQAGRARLPQRQQLPAAAATALRRHVADAPDRKAARALPMPGAVAPVIEVTDTRAGLAWRFRPSP